MIGCWLGAFPLPLDWDRPWQAWPLTPAYGAIAGNILGGWCALLTNVTYYLAEEDKKFIREEKEKEEAQSKGKKKAKGKSKKVE